MSYDWRMQSLPDGYFVQDVQANSYLVDDVSIAMLGVLMESPRIPLTTLAQVVQASSTAVRRRWDELQRSGLAWSSALPRTNPKSSAQAFIEVSIDADECGQTIQDLKRSPHIISIYEFLSDPNFLLTAVASTPHRLQQKVLAPLRKNPCIRIRRVSLATRHHRSGADWRPIPLTDLQRQRLDQVSQPESAESSEVCFADGDFEALQILARDARVGSSQLARQMSENRSSVGRRLTRILNSECMQPRLFIAPGLIGLPLKVFWFARVPTAHYRRTLRGLAKVPQIVSMMSITGESNLLFSVSLRSLEQVFLFEQYLQRLAPSLELTDSRTVVNTHKRWGWLLTEFGTRTGEFVPLSLEAWLGDDARIVHPDASGFED